MQYSCMFAIKDENLIVSAMQTLYNTIAINNLIPLDIVDDTVRANIPSTISHETLSTIYGVIMPPAFLMLGKIRCNRSIMRTRKTC